MVLPMKLLNIAVRVTVVLMVLLLIPIAGCKSSPKLPGSGGKAKLPNGWPAGVPVMRGLELTFGERTGNFMIVTAKGTLPPPDIAKFYQTLPGWTPEPGAVSTWNEYGELPPFDISDGKVKVSIRIYGEKSLVPYKSGDVVNVELGCMLH
jgi:hypothetical protein